MDLSETQKPLLLTPKDEEILKVINTYRYATTLDIAHLLYRPTYLPYVRKRLSRLSGGADLQPDTYLVRFWLPSSVGNRERIFTLGEKGRAFLREVAGLTVDWRFQIAKFKFFSFSNILHHLLLTRFLVACHVWAKKENATILQEGQATNYRRTPRRLPCLIKKPSQSFLTRGYFLRRHTASMQSSSSLTGGWNTGRNSKLM